MRQVPTITVDDVVVRFGAVTALDGVSFTVEPRTVHAIIGPNGAGKSTMLNVLSAVYRPSSGAVHIGEQNAARLRPHRVARLGVARAFQNIALSGEQVVEDNLMLGRHTLTRAGFVASGARLPRARREEARHRARIHEIAEFLDLTEHLRTPVAELSYGGQKRVEIARALAMEPSVLLLDEPVAGMNAGEKRYIASLIAHIRQSLGISIVLVEHDMEVVMSLSDRVTVLDFGRLIADGAPADVQENPEVIGAYLGRPAENAS